MRREQKQMMVRHGKCILPEPSQSHDPARNPPRQAPFISACPPPELELPAVHDAKRVIMPPVNLTAMSQKAVHFSMQRPDCALMIESRRFPTSVTAGRDQKTAGKTAHQKFMQRRCREHDSRLRRIVRRKQSRMERTFLFPFEQNNRRGGCPQNFRLQFICMKKTADILQGTPHQSQRFLSAMLELAQSVNRLRRPRIGKQLESADAFQCKDSAPLQYGNSPVDRIGHGNCASGRVQQFQMRPALWTTDSLRMKTAVRRVLILFPTIGAQRKILPCGMFPFIRQTFDYGCARPALSTTVERITGMAIGRGMDFCKALRTRRTVGRSQAVYLS